MDHKIVGTMGNLLRKKGLHDSASSCERQIKNGNWVVIQLNTKVRLHLADIQLWNLNGILHFFLGYMQWEKIYTWEKKEMESDESYKVKQSEKVRDLERERSWTFFCSLSRVSAHECFKSFCRLPRRDREVVNRLTCFFDMKSKKKPQWFISKMWCFSC